MNALRRLTSVSEENALQVATVTLRDFSQSIRDWNESGLTARSLRGGKMRTYGAMMDEFGAALQFPYYFGENWPALYDCLHDMDWLPHGEGLVLAISTVSEVLAEEPTSELETLIRTFTRTIQIYSQPVDDGEWWDRPPVPFHIVLQQDPDSPSSLNAWRDAGATLTIIDL